MSSISGILPASVPGDLQESPPDWASTAAPDLLCPLCEYSLRGLGQPRCPECGFAFSWAELIRGQRERHPFLFEQQPKRNIWSFVQTWCADAFPNSFWRSVSPAQPVHLFRLGLFFVIASIPTLCAFLATFVYVFVQALPPAGGVSAAFFKGVAAEVCDEFRRYPLVTGSVTVMIWPWFSLLFLLVFSQSMRRAKVKKRHVLRAVIYSCDFSVLPIFFMICGLFFKLTYSDGWPLWIAAICAGLSLHRLYFAYARYLRFHLPFVTVLTSQIMVFLVASIVYFQLWPSW